MQSVLQARKESASLDATTQEAAQVTKQDKLLMAFRACLFAMIDAIEDYLDMPRTKDARKAAKRANYSR